MELSEEYRKIEIYSCATGKHLCSTTRYATCKEAAQAYNEHGAKEGTIRPTDTYIAVKAFFSY